MLLRSLIISLFCGVLALTSVTLAVAQHGTVMGGTAMVLCTGQGAQIITLDAQGNPVPMAHPCPDCVAAIAAQGAPSDTALPGPPLVAQPQTVLAYAFAARSRAVQSPQARGPPWMV